MWYYLLMDAAIENPFFICKDYCLLIYETKDHATSAAVMAAAAFGASAAVAGVAKYYADHWSKPLKSKVLYSNPGDIIFFIRKEFVKEDEFWFVIIGEKVGWIIVRDWMKIEELNGQ